MQGFFANIPTKQISTSDQDDNKEIHEIFKELVSLKKHLLIVADSSTLEDFMVKYFKHNSNPE